MAILLEKHDPPTVYASEETLELSQEKVAKFVRDFKSLAEEADESLAKHKALELEIEHLLRAVVSQDIMSIVQNNSENEYALLWNDWYKKYEECKYDKISYDKAYNDMKQKIERLQAQLGDPNGKSKDTPCVSDNLDPLPQKLENENVELKINPFKNSREVKSVPNKPIKASVMTNLITVPQPYVTTKKASNSDSNSFSSTGVDITTKTRRPQPMSNTKNDRVPSASKNTRIKNKEVEVEEHPRNLLLSKNKKHMSSECNNVKLAIRNDNSEIVCAMCKQCLITANHDVYMLKYVNGMNYRDNKQKGNVSNTANPMKHMSQVKKPKKAGFSERLASPKPSKPRMCLRWSATRKMFDIKGKLIRSSDSECYPYINFLGTVRFGYDHVAAILGFDDLQWEDIVEL
ncbi:hypothetical protein Tco_0559920 [Tanacetum coccineum]